MKQPPRTPQHKTAAATVTKRVSTVPQKKQSSLKVSHSPRLPKEQEGLFSFFHVKELLKQEDTGEEIIADEADSFARYRRLMGLINAQALAIGILVGILIVAAPIMRPINRYFTLSPTHEKSELAPLFEPNLTNKALLAWAATSVTEVMTVGFGDFDNQIMTQQWRYTSYGWMGFLKSMAENWIREKFKSRQLVLTTIPSNAPVIVAQGPDKEFGYRWMVEVPVVMTFLTNDNVSQKNRAIVRLTIVRVPSRVSIGGIAIQSWDLI